MKAAPELPPESTMPFHESPRCLLWPFFGVVLNSVFQTALNRHLDRLPPVRANVESQRSKLAAIQTNDAATRRAVEESLVEGYRLVL
jgi:hypothetical protein